MLGAGWVALGSALGGMTRYAVSGFIANRIGETFPLGTLVVNVSGSFVIGGFAALIAPGGPFPGNLTILQFAMIGVCGGYTTFSSFSLQTLNLARDGEWARALGNIALSVACCLLAVWAGFALGAYCSGA
jgi:fluoride exporter